MTFTRSVEEILSLLTPNTPSSSSNSILTSPTIIYYGGPLRSVGITDNAYALDLEFNSNARKTFSIRDDCTYIELFIQTRDIKPPISAEE